MEEAQHPRREMRFMRFWRLLSRFAPPARRAERRRFSGYLLLERA